MRVTVFAEPRPLEAGDVDAVADLWHEAWHDAHGGLLPDEVRRHRTPQSFAGRLPAFGTDAFVVADGDGPLAFAALVGHEVDQFFLARRARGTGLAASLMDRLEAILAARGHRTAELECAVGNERARRFYRSRGFREIGEATRPVWMPEATDTAATTFPMHLFAKTLGT
jgi:GNAT superfamily N-acetyltransferase